MADSIAGTVTAILCVVVGLLIIGTALIPIVEHASTETTTEEGQNDVGDDPYYLAFLSNGIYDIQKTSTGGLINGEPIGAFYIRLDITTYMELVSLQIDESVHLYIENDGTIVETQAARVIVTDSAVTVEGSGNVTSYERSDTPPYLDSQSKLTFGIPLYSYPSSPVKIGSSQAAYAPSMDGWMTVDGSTEPGNYGPITVTKNGGLTEISWSADIDVLAPVTYIEETATASQYSALYAIIPVMLILSMAYVLIRRL